MIIITWNTVNIAFMKSSKLQRGLSSAISLNISSSAKLNLPPNICIPSKADIIINKPSSNNKLAIDFIEFNNETTKLRNEVQCLWKINMKNIKLKNYQQN